MHIETYNIKFNNSGVQKIRDRQYVFFRFPNMKGHFFFSFSHGGYTEIGHEHRDRLALTYINNPNPRAPQLEIRRIETNQFRIMVNPDDPSYAQVFLFQQSENNDSVHVSMEYPPEIGKVLFGEKERSMPYTQIIELER